MSSANLQVHERRLQAEARPDQRRDRGHARPATPARVGQVTSVPTPDHVSQLCLYPKVPAVGKA